MSDQDSDPGPFGAAAGEVDLTDEVDLGDEPSPSKKKDFFEPSGDYPDLGAAVTDVSLDDEDDVKVNLSAMTLEPQGGGEDGSMDMKEDNSSLRKITIPDREERGDYMFSKYVVFNVFCDPTPQGIVKVSRRYSDFVWLRTQLCELFPPLFVPPMPPKKVAARLDENFLDVRMKDLERWLGRLEKSKPFRECPAFEMFLGRPEASWKEGQKEIAVKLTSEGTPAQKIYNLQNLFPDIHEEDLDQNATHDVPRLREFLVRCQQQLTKLFEAVTIFVSNARNSAEEARTFSNSMLDLYDAEENYPMKPNPQRKDVRSQFEAWAKFHDKQTELIKDNLYQTVRYELQDVGSFLESIDRRDAINKQTEKAIYNADYYKKQKEAGTLAQKYEEAADTAINAEKEMKEYLEIVTKILLKCEIRRFWINKINNFKAQIRNFARQQVEATKSMAGEWKNANVKTQSASS